MQDLPTSGLNPKLFPCILKSLIYFGADILIDSFFCKKMDGNMLCCCKKKKTKTNPKTQKKEKQVRNVSLFSGLGNDFRCWLCWQFGIIFSPACPSLALFGGREWRLPVASLGAPICSPSLLTSLPSPLYLPPSRSASLCCMFPFQKVISWLMHLRFHQKVESLIRQTDALLGFHWQITIPLIKTMCLYITKLIPAGSLLVLHPDLPRLWILTPCDSGGTKTI